MPNRYPEFAERLTAAMEKGGITVNMIKNALGISYEMARRYTLGQALPREQRLIELAKLCHLSPSYLSYGEGDGGAGTGSTFATDARYPLPAAPSRQLRVEQTVATPHHITAHHPDDPIGEDFVYVRETKVRFSAGNGHNISYELVEDSEPAQYRRAWFQKNHINPNQVQRFRVTGNSMEPLLFENDTILVNLSETNIIDGKLYAIRYGDDLRVKYISKRIDGTLVLKSVNPDYAPEEVSRETVEEHISIIGRVRDRSGTGGL
jgi:phage repressor protein C with HTH and peptisase S24 domain